MSQAINFSGNSLAPSLPRKSCLKKQDTVERRSDRRARFDEQSISRTYLFDMEGGENTSEAFELDEKDSKLGFDESSLELYGEELDKVREARKRQFELKAKNHHRDEFKLIKLANNEEEEFERTH